ncbi:MAG TPA: DUF488 family protein [Acidobacteriota bacterium]|nr:DUF488 family protein [Acidobacteriota bacterium]
MKITISRIYEDQQRDRAFRVLVDRLWPRGIRKENAFVDLWAREMAPSDSLRKWFHQNREEWDEFRKRYLQELNEKEPDLSEVLGTLKRHEHIKLLYSSRETDRNNATVLKEWLEQKLG